MILLGKFLMRCPAHTPPTDIDIAMMYPQLVDTESLGFMMKIKSSIIDGNFLIPKIIRGAAIHEMTPELQPLN